MGERDVRNVGEVYWVNGVDWLVDGVDWFVDGVDWLVDGVDWVVNGVVNMRMDSMKLLVAGRLVSSGGTGGMLSTSLASIGGGSSVVLGGLATSAGGLFVGISGSVGLVSSIFYLVVDILVAGEGVGLSGVVSFVEVGASRSVAVVLSGVSAGAGVKSVLDAVDVGVKTMDTMDTMDCVKAVWVRKVMSMEFESGVQGIFSGFSGVFGCMGRFFACITTMMEIG